MKRNLLVAILITLGIAVAPQNAKADPPQFSQIAAGYVHTCALDSYGQAYCWGENDIGQMGNGTTSVGEPIPVQVDMTVLPPHGSQFTSLAAGGAHTCGITNSNPPATFCWGYDSNGQIGDGGANTDRSRPTLIDTSNIGNDYFVSLSLGGFHSCGLTASGKIFCWGRDNQGQLGNNQPLQDQSIPAQVPFPNGVTAFTSIAAGLFHTCAIANNGHAYCWGDDHFGQLGNDSAFVDQASPVPVDMTLLGGAVFTNLKTGSYHTCGIASNGNTYCWGDNYYRQLGAGSSLSQSPVPIQVDNTFFENQRLVSIALGDAHTCGFTQNGTPYCWGAGESGQLGNGTNLGSDPVLVDTITLGGESFRIDSFTAGYAHTCGIAGNGYTFCWGKDDVGQLGHDSSFTNENRPSLVGNFFSPVITTNSCPYAIENRYYSCQISVTDQDSGSASINLFSTTCPWIQFDPEVNLVFGTPSPSDITEGCNFTLRAEDITNPPQMSFKTFKTAVFPYDHIEPFTALSTGDQNTCAVSQNNNTYCWGYDRVGQLGNGPNPPNIPPDLDLSQIPVAVNLQPLNGSHFTKLTTGSGHSCGLTESGIAYCWGYGANGRLGNSSTENQFSPTAVYMAMIPGWAFSDIDAGYDHTCAVDSIGLGYCWGSNYHYQLGNSDPMLPTETAYPQRINMQPLNGELFTLIRTGELFSCGLTNTGRAFCWGGNYQGNLGDGTTTIRRDPTPVDMTPLNGHTFTSLAVGNSFVCGLAENGQAYCWGAGSAGQLGNGTNVYTQSIPVAVDMSLLGGEIFSKITAGEEHACGLTNFGNVFCWGYSGTNVSPNIPTPINSVPFLGERVIDVSGGYHYNCAITETGHAFCWGLDNRGILGNGETYSSTNNPMPVFMPIRINHLPVLTIPGNSVNGTVGRALHINISASDPDLSDVVTVTANNLPSGANLSGAPGNPANYILNWIPTQAGVYSVNLNANDGQDSVAGTMIIQVQNPVRPRRRLGTPQAVPVN